MTTFDELRALFAQDAGQVKDLTGAWEQVRVLFAKLDIERESGDLAVELGRANCAANDERLVEILRLSLVDQEIAVVFHTMDFDDGDFLVTSSAKIYFDDGTVLEYIDLPGEVDDILTEYGPVGPHAALGVDLRTSRVEFDTYGHKVPGRLGLPTS